MIKPLLRWLRSRSLFAQIISVFAFIFFLTLSLVYQLEKKHTQDFIKATSYETALNAVKSILPIIEKDLEDVSKLRRTLHTLQVSNPSFLYCLITKKNAQQVPEYYLHVSIYKGSFKTSSHTLTVPFKEHPEFQLKVIYDNHLYISQIKQHSFFGWWVILLFLTAMGTAILLLRSILHPLRTHAKRMFELTKPLDKELTLKDNEDESISDAFNVIMQSNRINESKLKMLNVHLEDLIDSKTAFLKEEIKERQLAENQLENSIGEKIILLKEVHHRVKNNLAVITGLIRMQSRRIDDPNIKAMFADLQNRVKTMELIHTNLYASKDFNQIKMQDYLTSLAENLTNSFIQQKNDITFTITCDQLLLKIDQAITCGQIVNELVTNAFKHAFKDQSDGRITITMKEIEGICHLRVADNGKGHIQTSPEKFSLGLSLVHELTRYQLKGNVEILEENGLKYYISFKKL